MQWSRCLNFTQLYQPHPFIRNYTISKHLCLMRLATHLISRSTQLRTRSKVKSKAPLISELSKSNKIKTNLGSFFLHIGRFLVVKLFTSLRSKARKRPATSRLLWNLGKKLLLGWHRKIQRFLWKTGNQVSLILWRIQRNWVISHRK